MIKKCIIVVLLFAMALGVAGCSEGRVSINGHSKNRYGIYNDIPYDQYIN